MTSSLKRFINFFCFHLPQRCSIFKDRQERLLHHQQGRRHLLECDREHFHSPRCLVRGIFEVLPTLQDQNLPKVSRVENLDGLGEDDQMEEVERCAQST